MINFSITDIRLFLDVAKNGQLKPAASASCMTVSAASLRIKKLEQSFKVKLFERLPRGLALTPAGECFQEEAQAILLESENLVKRIQAFNGQRQDTIRLFSNYGGLNGALHTDIGEFLALHPESRVDFSLRTSSDAIEAVAEGIADIAVANYVPNEPVPGMELLNFYEYYRDNYGLLIEKNHPLAHTFGKTVSLKELENFPLVALNSELISQDWFENRARELGLHFNIRARFPSIRAGFETMKQIGGGMLVLRSSYAAHEPEFHFIELSDVWRRLDNRICILKDRTKVKPLALELCDFLCQKGQTYYSEYLLRETEKKL